MRCYRLAIDYSRRARLSSVRTYVTRGYVEGPAGGFGRMESIEDVKRCEADLETPKNNDARLIEPVYNSKLSAARISSAVFFRE